MSSPATYTPIELDRMTSVRLSRAATNARDEGDTREYVSAIGRAYERGLDIIAARKHRQAHATRTRQSLPMAHHVDILDADGLVVGRVG